MHDFGTGELIAFADDLWTASTPVRFAGTWFPHVMSVVRLQSGLLLLHSPCKPLPTVVAALRELGEVSDIVQPNWFHDLYLREYKELFPQATLWTTKMLQRERAPWFSELPYIQLQGLLTFNECIFFHNASQTLIVADLLLNAKVGVLAPPYTRIGYRFFGLDGRVKMFPLLRWFGFDARASLRAARNQVTAWQPERLIVGHGTPVEHNACELVLAALDGS